ncbi:MAG: hypothetical protein R6V58_14875 [Planctomycetota bacterium]
MIVLANRASAILYNLLRSAGDPRPFLLPANICPIVPLTFLKAKAAFEFVDISPRDSLLDWDEALARLSRSPGDYAGLLFAPTYGRETPVEHHFRAARSAAEHLTIIDDRCLMKPQFAEHDTIADAVLYSTGPTKYVGAEFGGFGFIKEHVPYEPHELPYDPAAPARLRAAYKQAVRQRRRFHDGDGHWLDTASPDVSFDEFRRTMTARMRAMARWKQKLNDIYASGIPRRVQLPRAYQHWRFNILVPNKQALLDRIFAEGLFASSHYPSLDGIFSDGRSPHAQALHDQVVNLFNDKHFTADQARAVTQIVCEHLEKEAT